MTYVEGEVFKLRQRVATLERQIEFLMKHLGVEYEEEPNTGVSPEILELVRKGDKLRAIKFYREETGVGLREAKEFIESLDT
jgi:large subunit ribosomal protein L7/L12